MSADGALRRALVAPTDDRDVKRGSSITLRLTWIVLAVAIPMLLVSAGIISWLDYRERETQRDAMMYASRSIMSAVDAQLGKYVTLAQTLGTSPSLQTEDLVAFREQANRALLGLPGTWVSLADPQGQRLLNTLVPAGEPLSFGAPDVLADQVRAFETGQTQISNVVVGPATKILAIAVGAPVFHAGEPLYYVVVGIDVNVFRGLLNGPQLPEGWLAGVMDRSGIFIARSRDHERWAGKPVSPGWRAVMNQEGWFDIPSVEGDVYTAASVASPLSGWVFGAAARKDVFEAPIRQTVVIASVAGLVVTLSSILLATWFARTFTHAIRALERAAHALRHHESMSLVATGVPEVDHALQAFETAAQELSAHEKKRAEAETALKESQARLLQSSRLSEIGQMAAALAHELNQPLTAVASYIGGCRRILGFDDIDKPHKRKLLEVMEKANAQALRAGEIIRRLREFIGAGQMERTVEDAAGVMREACTLAIAAARHNGVSIRSDIDKAGQILVDKVQIQQVIVNLARNAIEAMESSSRKELEFALSVTDDRIELSVSDTGAGVPPEMSGRLFKPFSSTKSQGMGIGLSVCRKIVEAHDGRIWAETNPGGGTVFRFTLPLVGNEMMAQDHGSLPARRNGRGSHETEAPRGPMGPGA